MFKIRILLEVHCIPREYNDCADTYVVTDGFFLWQWLGYIKLHIYMGHAYDWWSFCKLKKINEVEWFYTKYCNLGTGGYGAFANVWSGEYCLIVASIILVC